MNAEMKKVAMVVLMVVGFACAGCVSRAQQLKPTLRVGIVNLDRILPELAEYRQYSDQYLQDRERLFKDVGDQNNPQTMQKLFADEKKKQEVEQSIQKWDDTRRKFLDRVSDEVRTASNQVAHDKGIDIVLVSAPWFQVSESMAVDITTDVIFALRDTGKTIH